MKGKDIDVRDALSVVLMTLHADNTVTVAIDGDPDVILQTICGAVDISVKNGNDDFPLMLLAGLELYCINHTEALEDLITRMRDRITLHFPKPQK